MFGIILGILNVVSNICLLIVYDQWFRQNCISSDRIVHINSEINCDDDDDPEVFDKIVEQFLCTQRIFVDKVIMVTLITSFLIVFGGIMRKPVLLLPWLWWNGMIILGLSLLTLQKSPPMFLIILLLKEIEMWGCLALVFKKATLQLIQRRSHPNTEWREHEKQP